MQVAHLPAKNSKEEAYLVKVTNAKIEGWEVGTYENGVVAVKPDSGKGITLELPPALLGYNQYDSMAEFVTDCGNDAKALTIVNEFKRSASLDAAKATIRTTTNKDINAVVTAALASAIGHTFQETEAITGKEAKDMLNELKADAANLSPDDLAAKLKAMFGL